MIWGPTNGVGVLLYQPNYNLVMKANTTSYMRPDAEIHKGYFK